MKVKLRPAKGRIVRDPASKVPLPAKGQLKELNTFWRRRLKDGDVEVVEQGSSSTVSSKDDSKKGGKE